MAPNEEKVLDILMDIKERVSKIEVYTTQIPELEKRIHKLESWRFLIIGIAITVGYLFPKLGEKLYTWAT